MSLLTSTLVYNICVNGVTCSNKFDRQIIDALSLITNITNIIEEQTDRQMDRPSDRDARTTGNIFHYLTVVIYYRNYHNFLFWKTGYGQRERVRK